jgi:tetratricopeptide (TPR) repeat protein
VWLKYFLLLAVWIVSIAQVEAQSPADSLKRIYYHQETTLEAKSLASAQIAEAYLHKNIDTSRLYARIGLEMAYENNLTRGIFRNSCVLGKTMLMLDSLQQALEIFENASVHFEKLEDPRDALCIFLLLGYVNDMLEDYHKAHQALYTGLRIAEETHDSAFLWSYFNNLGSHYIALMDYRQAIGYLNRSNIVYNTLTEGQKKFSLASVFNNLGICYLNLKELDSALYYFHKALLFPEMKTDLYGRFNLLNNLGEVAFQKGNFEDALNYFTISGQILDSMQGRFEGGTQLLFAYHYNNLGNIYLARKEYSMARHFFSKALVSNTLSNEMVINANAYEGLSKVYESENNQAAALEYFKKFTLARDSLQMKARDHEITRLTLEYQFEQNLNQKQLEIDRNEFRHRRRELVYTILIIVILASLLILFLLYRLQWNRTRRHHLEEKAVRLENEKISEELDYRNKELTTNVLYLLKKNELIMSISRKLADVMEKLDKEDAEKMRGIIAELDKITIDNTWDEFELRFKEVHTEFYNRLVNQYPDLTAQELRICAFLRLNMTNKEIAAITFQSTDSLKTARYRLRKKLGIERDENLVSFLTRI